MRGRNTRNEEMANLIVSIIKENRYPPILNLRKTLNVVSFMMGDQVSPPVSITPTLPDLKFSNLFTFTPPHPRGLFKSSTSFRIRFLAKLCSFTLLLFPYFDHKLNKFA